MTSPGVGEVHCSYGVEEQAPWLASFSDLLPWFFGILVGHPIVVVVMTALESTKDRGDLLKVSLLSVHGPTQEHLINKRQH